MNPKPVRRPARAPAFICFQELRRRAAAYGRQARHWEGLGNGERAAAWREAANDLACMLDGLEGKP